MKKLALVFIIAPFLTLSACKKDDDKPCNEIWTVHGYLMDPSTGLGYHNLNYWVEIVGEEDVNGNFDKRLEVGNVNVQNGAFSLEYECNRSGDWSDIVFLAIEGESPVQVFSFPFREHIVDTFRAPSLGTIEIFIKPTNPLPSGDTLFLFSQIAKNDNTVETKLDTFTSDQNRMLLSQRRSVGNFGLFIWGIGYEQYWENRLSQNPKGFYIRAWITGDPVIDRYTITY